MGIGKPNFLNAGQTLNFYTTAWGSEKRIESYFRVFWRVPYFIWFSSFGVDIWLHVPYWPCTAYSCQIVIYLQIHIHQNVCPCHHFYLTVRYYLPFATNIFDFPIHFQLKRQYKCHCYILYFSQVHWKDKILKGPLINHWVLFEGSGPQKGWNTRDVSCRSLYLSYSKYNNF